MINTWTVPKAHSQSEIWSTPVWTTPNWTTPNWTTPIWTKVVRTIGSFGLPPFGLVGREPVLDSVKNKVLTLP